jgi:hypothetical protein
VVTGVVRLAERVTGAASGEFFSRRVGGVSATVAGPRETPRPGGAHRRERLLERWRTDVAARIGSHERHEQTRESVRQSGDTPKLERYAQSRPLLVVELNGPARTDSFEPLNNVCAAGDGAQFSEQHVAFVPADLDELSHNLDLDSVEPLRHDGSVQL